MFEWFATTYGAQYCGQEIPGGKTPGLFAEFFDMSKRKGSAFNRTCKGPTELAKRTCKGPII